MSHYSALSLFRHGLTGHKSWQPAWREAELKKRYSIVIVGAGGQGLATAYYLAKIHGITDVAVLEAGWLGGGNTGRNTTVIRSNYFYPQSANFYDYSVQLYEGLSKELNYNIMFSQRGMMMTGHDKHGMEMLRRSYNAMLLNGVDAEMLDTDEVQRRLPLLDPERYPVIGALNQPRGGTARHDAVAWGYARAASKLGVDIIQQCAVTDFIKQGDSIVGVRTSKGDIRADKVGLAVAGHTSVLAGFAEIKLPISSHALQATVSEPLKPVLDTVVLSSATGSYISQSDKGELVIGGGLDMYPSYAQRGNLPVLEHTLAGILDMFPSLSRVRLLRQWAGIVDIVHDSSPIIDRSPAKGIYLNCGWGTGGFKAIPAGGSCFAHLLATEQAHPLAEPFSLKRFETGAFIDESAAAGIAH